MRITSLAGIACAELSVIYQNKPEIKRMKGAVLVGCSMGSFGFTALQFKDKKGPAVEIKADDIISIVRTKDLEFEDYKAKVEGWRE